MFNSCWLGMRCLLAFNFGNSEAKLVFGRVAFLPVVQTSAVSSFGDSLLRCEAADLCLLAPGYDLGSPVLLTQGTPPSCPESNVICRLVQILSISIGFYCCSRAIWL
jgi:hypothetical protein